jgi:hypothetical protein
LVFSKWIFLPLGSSKLGLILLADSNLPDNPAIEFQNGTLVIPGEDLKVIFDRVIGQVLVLLTQQVDAVKRSRLGTDKITIILVGGFGSNSYLRQHIEEGFADISVIQPPDS